MNVPLRFLSEIYRFEIIIEIDLVSRAGRQDFLGQNFVFILFTWRALYRVLFLELYIFDILIKLIPFDF